MSWSGRPVCTDISFSLSKTFSLLFSTLGMVAKRQCDIATQASLLILCGYG